MIDRCLTPETGEVFLPNTKNYWCAFLRCKERSGFSTRGCAEISSKYDLLLRWHHRCSLKGNTDENYPATIFFELVSNGDTSMGLGGISRNCLDSDFCEGPDDQTSQDLNR
jgi:hypothetical protein